MLSAMLEDREADDAARILFLSGAAIMGAVAVYGFWKPRFVLNQPTPRSMANALRDVRSLIHHWPVYPALLIWLLWNFAPGSATPLQYYLQDGLKAEDAQWGQWNAIFTASFAPTFLLFGILCQRIALRRLLLWGTVIAIPQMVPLLFIKSIAGALIAAVPIGLMGGVATAAYIDLIIRVTPRGMEGTTLMISSSLFFISSRFGDVLGTNIYNGYGGFAACVIAITLVYALIVPVILLIPKDVMAKSDG
jgi:Na+/melibiose symporter-like transporter